MFGKKMHWSGELGEMVERKVGVGLSGGRGVEWNVSGDVLEGGIVSSRTTQSEAKRCLKRGV